MTLMKGVNRTTSSVRPCPRLSRTLSHTPNGSPIGGHNMSLGNLRQGATKVSNQTSKGGGGSKGGYFNKWRPPKLTPQLQGMLRPNEPAGDPIMLVRPEQLYDDQYDTDEQGRPKGTKTEALHVMVHQVKRVKNGKETYDE